MSKSWLAVTAGALAVLMISATFDTAAARRGGGLHGFHGGGMRGFHGGGMRAFSGRSFHAGRMFRSGPRFSGHFRGHHHHHHHSFRGRRLFYGAIPLATYGYYGGDCYWLYRRALGTGSGYWWDRYHACVSGYDY